jgi:hypothetical protein
VLTRDEIRLECPHARRCRRPRQRSSPRCLPHETHRSRNIPTGTITNGIAISCQDRPHTLPAVDHLPAENETQGSPPPVQPAAFQAWRLGAGREMLRGRQVLSFSRPPVARRSQRTHQAFTVAARPRVTMPIGASLADPNRRTPWSATAARAAMRHLAVSATSAVASPRASCDTPTLSRWPAKAHRWWAIQRQAWARGPRHCKRLPRRDCQPNHRHGLPASSAGAPGQRRTSIGTSTQHRAADTGDRRAPGAHRKRQRDEDTIELEAAVSGLVTIPASGQRLTTCRWPVRG